MTSKVFAPFAFIPTSIASGTGTYTVPAGKRARFVASLSVCFVWRYARYDFGSVVNAIDVPFKSDTKEFWLNEGDVVTINQGVSVTSEIGFFGTPIAANNKGRIGNYKVAIVINGQEASQITVWDAVGDNSTGSNPALGEEIISNFYFNEYFYAWTAEEYDNP